MSIHRIYLVRHGEAAASWSEDPDPGLSALGQAQAGQAATSLQDELAGEVALVSSPLLRARETAEPLAERLALPVTIDESFREVPSPVLLAQRQGWLRRFMSQQWHEQPDTLLDWRNAILEQLVQTPTTTVVFTHFLVINAVVGSLLERPEVLCCWPANGSVTALTLEAGELSLDSLGEQMETRVN